MEDLKGMVTRYVEDNISVFHQKRIDGLKNLDLQKVLSKKNPYLFKAKYVLTAADIVKSLTDAYISSQEETIFGDWLEGLAIFVNEKIYNGRKSSTTGIDLEFDHEGIRYLVTIKSGPNWGNSTQIGAMKTNFVTATKTLRTSNSKINVRAVNGCCYGRENKPDKGVYLKYCGQKFWEFISGNKDFYTDIIEPLGHLAKERNEEFNEAYPRIINKFTSEFSELFCKQDFSIDWEKLVKFNSGEEPPPRRKATRKKTAIKRSSPKKAAPKKSTIKKKQAKPVGDKSSSKRAAK